MDCMSQQFLAGSRFAQDKDRNIKRRNPVGPIN